MSAGFAAPGDILANPRATRDALRTEIALLRKSLREAVDREAKAHAARDATLKEGAGAIEDMHAKVKDAFDRIDALHLREADAEAISRRQSETIVEQAHLIAALQRQVRALTVSAELPF